MKRFLPLLAVFVLCFSLCVPASAAFDVTTQPKLQPLPEWDTDEYPYAIVYWQKSTATPSIFTLYLFESRPYMQWTKTSNSVKWSIRADEGKTLFYSFTLNSSYEYWAEGSSGNGAWGLDIGYTDNITHEFVANFDLKLDDGTTVYQARDTSGFFPTPLMPLPEVIQGVTTETLTETTVPALGQTVSTVVLCGVGCLALLMVLVLFGKRSQIFHI